MRVSVRSYLMAGVAALAAGTVAIPPSITPTAPAPAPVHTQVRLAAETRTAWAPKPVIALIPKAATAGTTAATPVRTAAAGKTAAAPSAAPAAATVTPTAAALAFPGLSNAIIQGYDWVIGWVDYGVDLAQYAVGWIPVANIFAPQIGIVYYNLIEPILTSAVYNTAYVIGGQVDLIQGISNVVNDSIAAGRGFIQAEINWALSWLPPLPPLPFTATATTAAKTAAVSLTATAEPTDGKPPVTAEQQTDQGSEHETEPVDTKPTETEPVDTKPVETEPVDTKPVETEPADSTPVKEPSDTPATPESPKTPESGTAPEKSEKPDTTKPDTPKTDDTKTDDKKTDTKAGTDKTDTEKPAPKKAEPKKKKHDHPSAGDSAPKADTHTGSDAT